MGDVIVGEYLVDTTKKIGSGRFSTVFSGVHQGSGQLVAVKKINWSNSLSNSTKRDAIVKKLQQALAARKERKEYEHALALLDFQEVQGESYIVYELCDDTLDEYLGSTPLSDSRAIDILKQVVAIVYHKFATAHKTTLNRDVSPPNILVIKAGNDVKLKFADFALGHYAEDKQSRPPGYIAPEIVNNQEFIDKRKAEVYTLGLILYRLLFGRVPYSTASEMAEELKYGAIEIPEDAPISDEARSLLKRMLQLEPDKRIPLPAVMKLYGFDLPEPGSLRFSSNQNDLSPEMLLMKIEEATEEIVNLKEKIRRLEAEKLDIEFQTNLKLEAAEKSAFEMVDKAHEELQQARQELSNALEQILKSDEQYDALDTRKRDEIAELMRQLEKAHDVLESEARSSQGDVQSYYRQIEELKEAVDLKDDQLQDAKREHEMVEMFRQEELASLKKELDDLTELFVSIEQTRREDEERASTKYEDMVKQKDQEIAELRKQVQSGQNGLKLSGSGGYQSSNGTSAAKSYGAPRGTPSPEPGKFTRPPSTSPEPHSPRDALAPAPSPSPSPSPRPSPSPSPTPGGRTWGSTPAYKAPTPAGGSASTTSASKWTPPPKTPTLTPAAASSASSSTASTPPKWMAQPKAAATTTTPSAPTVPTTTTTTVVGQKPAWMTTSTKAAAAATPAASSAAAAASTTAAAAATPAAAAATPAASSAAAAAPAAGAYEGPLFSANELRGMLKNPGSAFEGFDKAQIEQYLHDAEFQQLLGMSKAAYNALPKWKQAPLKSKAKLF